MIHATHALPLINWAFVLAPILCSLFASRTLLHYFQLESYQFPGFFRTLIRNKKHGLLPGACVTLSLIVLFWIGSLIGLLAGQSDFWQYVVVSALLILSALSGIAIAHFFNPKQAKKKFVITARVKRLYTVQLIVMFFLSFFCSKAPAASISLLWPIILPLVVAISGLIAWPVEKLISECYFRDARKKLLANDRLIRIGITGSYGKTSVKHILGTILSEKYPTLITPASYNTPMGVSRAIRERLNSSYQVFVGEMGARHVGDIREMCRLVKPTIGVITSVGPQHLETFKSIERVAKTKYELIDALPQQDSHSYFYDDGAFCTGMYERTSKTKTLCGRDPERADVWCENIRVSPAGSTFVLHIRNKGAIECHTRLLGEHNIQNILLAAAVASDLGLSLKQISHGVEKLQVVKNRLELITRPGAFTIINDAFNSNPVGAKAALQVLKGFPQRRIIITPGMVELGEKETEYNYEFGQTMAECVDIAIIVGKNRVKPIIDGLKEAGFPEGNIHRVDSLDESTRLLHSIVCPTDTVLYENDLPDNYQEA